MSHCQGLCGRVGWSGPPTKVLHRWAQENLGGKVSDAASQVFMTGGTQWVFCILKFKERWGSRKATAFI